MAKFGIGCTNFETLIYDGHEYQRKFGVGITNPSGSVPWRCKQRKSSIKCPASVTQESEGYSYL